MDGLTWRERRLLKNLRENLREKIEFWSLEQLQREANRIHNQRLEALVLSIHQNAFTPDASSTTSRSATRNRSVGSRRE